MFTLYSLFAALSMAALLALAGLWCRRQQVPYAAFAKLCIAVIPLALVLSRLLFSLYAFACGDFTAPVQMLYFWDGGASLTGAFAGAVIAADLVEKTCRVKPGTLLDAIALGAPLAIFIERLAEPCVDADASLYGLGLGRIIDTDALAFLGEAFDGRHPVYIYQAVTAAIILLVLLCQALKGRRLRSGDLLLTFMTLYGGTQMVFSSLNAGGNDHMVWYFIRFDQIAGLIMLVIAYVLWTVRATKNGLKAPAIAGISTALALAIAKGIIQEFAVDSDPNLLWEYAQMVLCVIVMMALTLWMRCRANAEKEQ